MILAFSFLLGLLVSAALVPIWRSVALRRGYIVPPDIRPTARPKARLGGAAIALSLFAVSASLGVVDAVPVLVVCGIALFVFGVVSDLRGLKPSTRVIALIAIASVFLAFDLRLRWSDSLILDSLITLFWIVGITSAFNLLDNMDGLCGGIALIAGTAFLLTVLPIDSNPILLARTQYLVVLLGAVAGFLIYNVHPASVAMGESGSLLVGLNMAAMTLQFSPGRGSDLLLIVAVPLLLLLIPILDAMLMGLSRLLFASAASREYSSHRLVAIGLSERAAVGLLWVLAAASGVIGVVAGRSEYAATGLVAAMFTIGMAIFGVYLAGVQIHEDVAVDSLPGTVTPLGIEFGYRRRLGEILLDVLLISVAYNGAYRLRFEAQTDYADNFGHFLQTYPIVLATQMVMLLIVGAYRGMWRYFSLSDGVMFVDGVFLAVVTSGAAVLLFGFEARPGILITYGLLLLFLLVASRASFRLISEFAQRRRRTGQRLVIYGAGDAGSMAVRHLLNDSRSTYRIIGFIDDDVRKRSIRVHGYRVIGGYDHLAGMIMAREIDAVAVTRDEGGTSGLAWLCAKYGVTVYRLAFDWQQIPATDALVAGGTVALKSPEPRVLAFTDAGRDREDTGRPAPASASASRGAATSIRPVGRSQSASTAPIRVVHVITRLILGGAQENTLSTAIGQHRDPRFDVTLLCGVDEAGEGNMFAEANRAGVKTIVMPSLVREIRLFTDLKAVVDVYRFLKQGSFAVVHTHSSKAGIIGRIAARAAGVPVTIHTLHGLAFHEFQSAWKNRLFIALERLCAPITHKIISVSDRIAETALARGIGRWDQHVTIFSGIELDLFLSVRDRLTGEDAKRRAGIPPEAPVVGKIARLFPLKGHEQFMAVAAEIAREVPETYFLLVGDGPLRDQLAADADRLGLGGRVVMVGRVPPEAVPEYIQAMDVVVHTSLREGIARVLPQAGAVGKPVVTFALDGAPEVIRDGVSGYLVPPLDITGVATRTVALLRDPERCRALGEAGRAFAAEHFSVERMVKRVSAVYLDLMSNRR